jgi:hypothetical protein
VSELTTTQATPLSLIQAAIDKNLDTDKLEKLMQLQERWQANEAKKAFHDAMAACQADIPAVIKNAHNTQTGSDYATFDELNAAIKPIYTKHGFSLSFDEATPTDKGTMYFCDCAHSEGHVERRQLFLPNDGIGVKGSQFMTGVHGKISSGSYAQRILCKRTFNISEAGEDKDGNVPDGPITEAQGEELKQLLIDKNVSNEAFFGWASEASKLPITRLGQIPAYLFARCVDRLKKTRRA